MKGISPLLATIFIIAFTVGVAGIISVWLTGFTTTQTQSVGSGGQKLALCGASSIEITSAKFNCLGATKYVNMTVYSKTGSEILYNVSFFVLSGGAQNKTAPANNVLMPGDSLSSTINSTPSGNSQLFTLPCPYDSFRVTSLCQNSTVISDDCSNFEKCFVRAE